jgi:hypothetical protein
MHVCSSSPKNTVMLQLSKEHCRKIPSEENIVCVYKNRISY